jgi:MFS family permease
MAATPRSPTLIITVLSFCGIVVSLMQTLIVPLVPVLPQLLHASAADASWAITSTLVFGAVCTPIAGRLGDMYGKRRILAASLAALVVGSVLCALTSSLPPMIVGRALQGAATGVVPLGISIMRDELPRERVGSAIAVMSATLGVGGAVGMPLAAVVAQDANWHVLFWSSAALGVLSLVATLALIPESPIHSRAAAFDYAGAAGLTAALVALLLAVTKGGDWGWSGPVTLSLLATSVLLFLLWGAYELRRHEPLVDLRVSARPQVLFTNLASIAVGLSMYAMSLIPVQMLMAPKSTGYGMGLSMAYAGLVLMPGGLAMFALSPFSAKISARSGPRTTLLIGASSIAVGYLVELAFRSTPWEIMIAMLIVGGGIGLAYAAMPALIMGAVPIHETAAANGLNSLFRSIGTSLSSAIVSVVLAQMTMYVAGETLPSRTGFTVTICIVIGACLLAVSMALLIPSPRSLSRRGDPALGPALAGQEA